MNLQRILKPSLALVMFLVLCVVSTAAADTPRLLFIGNSYTYGNDLDQMTAQLMAKGAATWEDTQASRHAVGGARFVQHLAEPMEPMATRHCVVSFWELHFLPFCCRSKAKFQASPNKIKCIKRAALLLPDSINWWKPMVRIPWRS